MRENLYFVEARKKKNFLLFLKDKQIFEYKKISKFNSERWKKLFSLKYIENKVFKEFKRCISRLFNMQAGLIRDKKKKKCI